MHPRPTTPAPAPHRLNYLAVAIALLAVLVIGGGIAAIVASGNHEQTPTLTRVGAEAPRQLAAFNGTIENSTVAVSPPSSWFVQSKSSTRINLAPPDGSGINGYVSGSFGGTLLQLAQSEVTTTSKEGTNVRICLKPKKQRVPNGPAGMLFGICATVLPQNGPATQIVEALVLGVQRGVGTEISFISAAKTSVLTRLVSEARPVYSTVRWKLLR